MLLASAPTARGMELLLHKQTSRGLSLHHYFDSLWTRTPKEVEIRLYASFVFNCLNWSVLRIWQYIKMKGKIIFYSSWKKLKRIYHSREGKQNSHVYNTCRTRWSREMPIRGQTLVQLRTIFLLRKGKNFVSTIKSTSPQQPGIEAMWVVEKVLK